MDLFSGEKYLKALQVVKKLQNQGFQAVFAGGCVRDAFLKTEVKDFDIATSATPEEVLELFENTKNIGQPYASIFVYIEDEMIDVTTFRTDGPYTDGRHPDFVRVASHQEDVLRRDFTINALYYDPLKKQIIDWVGGVNDLSLKRVKAIGQPDIRFREDRLRMLRAIRFCAQFNFQLEPVTGEAIRDLSSQIITVSHERLTQELQLLLTHPHRVRGVQLLKDYGLLYPLLPECHGFELNSQQALSDLQQPELVEVLAILLIDLIHEPASKIKKMVHAASFRLRLTKQSQECLEFILINYHRLIELKATSISQLRRFLAKPYFQYLLNIYRAYEGEDHLLRFIEEQLSYYHENGGLIPPLIIQGKDLIQLGYEPGPLFAEIIKTIQLQQLEGQINNREEARAFIADKWG